MKKEDHKNESNAALRLKVIRAGATPICVQTLQIVCRGCPGWSNMKQALTEPSSIWRRYPIHCPATGLTVACEDE